METALVTGASTGLGYEFAKLLAQRGCALALVARNAEGSLDAAADALRAAYQVPVVAIAADLSLPEAPQAVLEKVHTAGLAVDILINCAGNGRCGPFAHSDPRQAVETIGVNITGLTLLTRLVLPQMLRRGSGRILNVSSVVAFQPDPYFAVYGASKAYVLRFSQSLSAELAGTGITVTALCPGSTRTQFSARAGRLDAGFAMEPEPVARLGIRGMLAGKGVVIPGLRFRLGVFAMGLIPHGLKGRLVRRFQAGLCKDSTQSGIGGT